MPMMEEMMADRSPAGANYKRKSKPQQVAVKETTTNNILGNMWVRVLDSLIHLLIRIRDKIATN